MLTQDQQTFLTNAAKAAQAAGHIFPEMAACEAADESAWGTSELAKQDFNLFGCKQHQHPVYGTVHIPTREFVHQSWVTEDAAWVQYPSIEACFEDRMNTLRTMMTTYPHYGLALAADNAEEYVTEVSLSWSTDPNRAAKCIAIYHAHKPLLDAAVDTNPEQGEIDGNDSDTSA